jgi:hypothetical protein
MRTMAGMNIKGKGCYSAPNNSVFLERILQIFKTTVDPMDAAESMTGMSTINSH